MSIFADRLKECRKNINKTQRDVACDLGIAGRSYQNYELGIREPNHETTVKIADYFGVSVDYLLEGKSPTRTDGFSHHRHNGFLKPQVYVMGLRPLVFSRGPVV